ncbi:1401_t:CDS:2 [Entrophospora sp. SA101]|nr:1401_t:CDS:2 [Entrophospora sp. SA101]CAJ0899522.1 3702_t:CDS:2 [Entrophospora sp. SA101]
MALNNNNGNVNISSSPAKLEQLNDEIKDIINQYIIYISLIFGEINNINDFIFYSERLATLLVERGLSEFCFKEHKVITPLNIPYVGKIWEQKLCGVSILRAGGTMETGLRRVVKDSLIGKILIQSDPKTGEPSLHFVKLPNKINECSVLLMDAQIATGAAALMAIRVLLDHSVPEDKIVFLSFIATPLALHVISNAFPKVKVCTSMIDQKLDAETLFIEPGMGNFGDRYYGT